MKGVKSIYIVDKKDSTVYFCLQLFEQGSCELQEALLSPFIVAFQNLASELGQQASQVIELMDKRFISAIDETYNLIFLIITDLKAKSKNAIPLVEQIKNVSVANLKVYGLMPDEIKSVRTSIFEKDILEIMGIKTRAADFLMNL